MQSTAAYAAGIGFASYYPPPPTFSPGPPESLPGPSGADYARPPYAAATVPEASAMYRQPPPAPAAQDSPDDGSDEEVDGLGHPLQAGGAAGVGGKSKKADKEVKRRSSKACDSCRKSKCKCVRAPLPDGTVPTTGPCQSCVATGVECTFNGTSRKRGPPKGYIEAIESRLHRMEALLGGLLQNDDPRAQALLAELLGDDETRDILKKDLKAANEANQGGKIRKSWKLPPLPALKPGAGTGAAADSGSGSSNGNGNGDGDGAGGASGAVGAMREGNPEDESEPEYDYGQEHDHELEREHDHGNDLEQTPAAWDGDGPRTQRRKLNPGTRGTFASASAAAGTPTSASRALDPPRVGRRHFRADTIPHTGTATYTLSDPSTCGTLMSPAEASEPPTTGDGDTPRQHLTADGVDGEPISELADVVGQLSLDENSEVRYHGRSSGLYLISKSQRYRNFFWHFPKAGVWPRAPADSAASTRGKVESEVDAVRCWEDGGLEHVLPPRDEMDHLLELYWAYVHPVLPVLYKVDFMRQYRSMLAQPDWASAFAGASPGASHPPPPSGDGLGASADTSAPASVGGNRVTILLLLTMFSLAARFSDRESQPVRGEYWPAGDRHLEKAKRLLNRVYASSKLTTCQALILLAYREIGVGAMAESWLYTGMAIRMAQDMGMFRDVEKWFMPVNKFSYDEKQTRKRVWWACVVLDKYVSTYIGRPMMIFERDYDTAFASPDEPDEHEQWRAFRPDGTDLSLDPPPWSLANAAAAGAEAVDLPRPAYPTQKIYAISCFNRSASLSVLTSRIIANIYAIRIRVIGQSSETLLSLLDQNLANWYLDLPEHLRYTPAGTKGPPPPPHVLTLHAQFYTALILLHRPFINGQQAPKEPSSYPSHSICTTAANAIATIASSYSKTFGLRQAPAFMVYYIFTAAILHVYNATFDPALAVTAKRNLLRCMNSLKEMESTWSGSIRAWELLIGLVDLRDVDVDLAGTDAGSPSEDRGVKRPCADAPQRRPPQAAAAAAAAGKAAGDRDPGVPAGSEDFLRLRTFHTRGAGRRSAAGGERHAAGSGPRRRRSGEARPKPASASPEAAQLPNPVFSAAASSASAGPLSMTVPAPTPSTPAEPMLGTSPLNVPGFEAFSQRASGGAAAAAAGQVLASTSTSTSTSYDIFGLTPPPLSPGRDRGAAGRAAGRDPYALAGGPRLPSAPSPALSAASAAHHPSGSFAGPAGVGVGVGVSDGFTGLLDSFLDRPHHEQGQGQGQGQGPGQGSGQGQGPVTPQHPLGGDGSAGAGAVVVAAPMPAAEGLSSFFAGPTGFEYLGRDGGGLAGMAGMTGVGGMMGHESNFDSNAFFGMPLSADAGTEEWQSYLPAAFFPPPTHLTDRSPDQGGGGGGVRDA